MNYSPKHNRTRTNNSLHNNTNSSKSNDKNYIERKELTCTACWLKSVNKYDIYLQHYRPISFHLWRKTRATKLLRVRTLNIAGSTKTAKQVIVVKSRLVFSIVRRLDSAVRLASVVDVWNRRSLLWMGAEWAAALAGGWTQYKALSWADRRLTAPAVPRRLHCTRRRPHHPPHGILTIHTQHHHHHHHHHLIRPHAKIKIWQFKWTSEEQERQITNGQLRTFQKYRKINRSYRLLKTI